MLTYNQLNDGIPTFDVFYDLTKAFDIIDHTILKLKLKNAGKYGECYNLLSNYLNNRFQRCKINNYLSNITYKMRSPSGFNFRASRIYKFY